MVLNSIMYIYIVQIGGRIKLLECQVQNLGFPLKVLYMTPEKPIAITWLGKKLKF